MRKTNIQAVLATFILCMMVWIFITWSFAVQELAAGVIVSAAVALFSSRFFIHREPWQIFNPVKIMNAVLYIFVFLKEVIVSNWEMAKRVYGGCKVNPGIVRIPTGLDGEYPLAVLADSITLTPGTITMDVAEEDGKNCMYIHWIDVLTEDGEEAGKIIKENLENGVRRIFG